MRVQKAARDVIRVKALARAPDSTIFSGDDERAESDQNIRPPHHTEQMRQRRIRQPAVARKQKGDQTKSLRVSDRDTSVPVSDPPDVSPVAVKLNYRTSDIAGGNLIGRAV